MQVDRALRLALALAVVLLALAIVVASLYLTERVLVVWDYMRSLPVWLVVAWAAAIGTVALLCGWLVLRLLLPRRQPLSEGEGGSASAPTEAAVQARLDEALAKGLDAGRAREQLQALAQRRETGRIFVAFYGEVSSGKSSLVKALVPDAQVDVSVRAGSTRRITHYTWRSAAGDELVLADVPGLQDHADPELGEDAYEEAVRAHLVVYVCDGDLTRVQAEELARLLAMGKPVIVALNKADRYEDVELESISARLRRRIADITGGDAAPVGVIPVSAGGEQQIVRVSAQGHEETVTRSRPPLVDALREAIQQRLDRDQEAMEALRDASVFVLATQQLDEAEAAWRREQADVLVQRYTRRAVVGALAAVAPGTDLVIQGVLGTALVRDMCKLYDAPVRDIDLQQFLDRSQKHVRREVPLLLAIAGNAFKAFPGVGTLAGGLLHAVAYGLIFDSLGRALAATLHAGGRLRPVPAAQLFREALTEDLEARTRRIAKMALSIDREGADANGAADDPPAKRKHK